MSKTTSLRYFKSRDSPAGLGGGGGEDACGAADSGGGGGAAASSAGFSASSDFAGASANEILNIGKGRKSIFLPNSNKII